jgi:predicted TIM-barrel fold metal-dependent hydrolase
VGPVPAPLDSRFSDPALLPKVAGDFPDLPMQAAHSGNEAWREVLEVAVSHSNVYCDLSGWQLRWMRDPGPFYADVRAILKGVGAERVMWGTDAPYFRPVAPDARWVEAFVDAPDGAFTPDEVEAILGGTATAFFGLA